jgi:uncharacterized membrane protein (UPF0127 family)
MKTQKYLSSTLTVLVVLIMAFTAIQCNNKKKERPKTNNNGELKEIVYSFENPPKFRKDGELVFTDKSGAITKYSIVIEVASTDEEKGRGLMYRTDLDLNQGMLFLFDRDDTQSFYMRNTIIPLDIIYVNSRFEIVDIYRNTKVLDETSLPSAAPAMYVVEVNAGICDKYKIDDGDKVSF